MIGHLLELDDLKKVSSPQKIVALFEKLGYTFYLKNLDIEQLDLPDYCSEIIDNAYIISSPKQEELQVFLVELRLGKFPTNCKEQEKIITIYRTISKSKNNFLLIGTNNYDKLIIIAPRNRKNINIQNQIKWWLIDCKNPSHYDTYWLESVTINYWESTGKFTNNKNHTENSYDPDLEPPTATFTEDSTQLYQQQINNISRLHPEEEIHLAHQIDELLSLKQTYQELEEKLKRSPKEQEWATAVEISLLELRDRLQQGRQAQNKMVKANLRLVVSIAKRYQNRGLDLQDLIQEGSIGLIRATEKFDHTKGYKFSTYGIWWIRQAITRAICDHSRTIRLPVYLYETVSQMKKIVKQMSIECFPLTAEEVATRMEMTTEKLRFIVECAQETLSLEEVLISQEENIIYQKAIKFDGKTPAKYVFESCLEEDVETVLKTLTERERSVLQMRFGFDDGQEKTLKEIGELFNLTRERIRQIEAKALKKLADPRRNRIVREYIR
ncbi:sigma-70 family RNA polymerase sigma factor [Okeania sp.]|uniref:sigma-70 family RNA polymerase sigma factor n=1 Tax=Okeania sp. TaxID=3100323 RepID=UPI002B4B6607|nr:sigma-70 family RNA polymerase sigma factor [Okeania sp.]MEB3340561.1 sigma-70 family RNA polymerase sigma factor [Okeania sp.]